MKTPLVILALAAGLLVAPEALPNQQPPLPPGTKLSWVDESDSSVADIRALGDRMIDRIGGMMLAEVRRVLATEGLEQAAEEVHLRSLEPPKAAPGKPQVIAIKRTSLRIRNPANAPDMADQAALDYIRQELSDGNAIPRLLMQKVEAPDRPLEYRMYKPIAIMDDCLLCHGSQASQQPAVQNSLTRQFPEDKAVNYSAGDWRGLIRISVLPATPEAATPAPK